MELNRVVEQRKEVEKQLLQRVEQHEIAILPTAVVNTLKKVRTSQKALEALSEREVSVQLVSGWGPMSDVDVCRHTSAISLTIQARVVTPGRAANRTTAGNLAGLLGPPSMVRDTLVPRG